MISGTYMLEEGEVIKAYIAIGCGETHRVDHKIKTIGYHFEIGVGKENFEWA